MDHRPTMNKVLSLLQNIERQKQITDNVAVLLTEANAYASFRHSNSKKPPVKTNNNNSATFKHCDHCNKNGHTRETCFGLTKCPHCQKTGYNPANCFLVRGFPNDKNKGRDKALFTKSAAPTRGANVADVLYAVSPLDDSIYQEDSPNGLNVTSTASTSNGLNSEVLDGIITSTVDQVLKRITDQQPRLSSANFACMICSHFYVFNAYKDRCLSGWIIDTGASNHIPYDNQILTNVHIFPQPVKVGLPYGSVTFVHKIGTVVLTDKISLFNVFHILDFKQNLLSVSKLLDNNRLSVVFTSHKCIFQDLSCKTIVAKGRRMGDLYRFDKKSLDKKSLYIVNLVKKLVSNKFHDVLNNPTRISNTSQALSYFSSSKSRDLVHSRMGHMYVNKMKYVPEYSHIIKRSDFHCESCVLTKHHMLPFPVSYNKASHCFDLLHLDVKANVKLIKLDNDTDFLQEHCGTLFKEKRDLASDMCSWDVLFKEQIFPYHKDKPHEDLQITTSSLVNPVVSTLVVTPSVTSNIQHSATASIPHYETHSEVELSGDQPETHNLQTQTSHSEPNIIRRPTRPRQMTTWLQDFQCFLLGQNHSTGSVQSTAFQSQVLGSLEDYHPEYIGSLSTVMLEHEPYTYKQAQKDPRWIEAMQKEVQALESNQTWDIVSLPAGHKAIGSKWVYKIKYNSDGSVERFKARLVPKGFNQVKDKDYKHNFSPVAKFTTVRALVVVAAAKHWPLFQLDINNAFLHGFLDEEVYMKAPEGYAVQEGLSRQDYSLFTKTNATDQSFTAALVYVDDVLLTGTSVSEIDKIKHALHSAFSIKDLGQMRYFLGLEISRNHSGLMINQRKYIMDILNDLKMENCSDAKFPMQQGLKLSIDQGELLDNPEQYRRLIRRSLYLNMSRLDISYGVQHLSQFVSNSRIPQMQAALHVVKYLKSTINAGLFYSAQSNLQLVAFSDADWGQCAYSCKSLSGYCVVLGSSLISWKTKKQATVSKRALLNQNT
ncbi:uncharacterized protein LOC141613508 [Silene latifolia]|uniref:uncharacterized protein LOC141613508 n=1 Tax=Silene latifolia TaxID=37657 RepID=UPI003D76BEF7